MAKESKSLEDPIAELEQYRRLLDNIPAEIGVFDALGRFLFNTPSGIRDPAVRRWVLGKTHHDYCRERGYPLAIADKRQAVIEECVREQRQVSFEEPWIDKSGAPRHYLRTFSPVADAAGHVTHVIGYGHEITDLKQTEEKLRRALAEVEELKDRLQAENVYLQEEIRTHHGFDEILGESAAIRSTLGAIETVAPTEANVVISGETGTGKELVARAIHRLSSRRQRPLIKVNCAAVPRELFESEFFGHVRGAFTGAVKDRMGRFQLADGGTLFLDEVGEIPLAMQSKLLRVLQEGEFERLGEERTRSVDVRIVAATNRDLKVEMEAGRFRQDLYYRLQVFPLEVAPLRRRPEDIPLLAAHFLRLTARKMSRPLPRLSRAEVIALQSYDWPGNVRELQNVVERAVITAHAGVLRFDLPGAKGTLEPPTRPQYARRPSSTAGEVRVLSAAEMRHLERENVLAALHQTGWRVYGPEGAAELLGLKPTTLVSRMRKMGLEKPGGPPQTG